MKIIKSFVCFIVFFSLISCKSQLDKVTGNWVNESCYLDDNGQSTIITTNTTYLSNKTFSSTTDFSDANSVTSSGNWDIKNGMLETIVTTSTSTDAIPIGSTSSDKIIEITDEKFVSIDKYDNYCEFYRNKQLVEKYKNQITINPEKFPKYYIEQACNLNVCENKDWKIKEFIKGDFYNNGEIDFAASVYLENDKTTKNLAIINGKTNELLLSNNYAEEIWLVKKDKVKKWVGKACGDGIGVNSEGIAHPYVIYYDKNMNKFEGCPGECYAE